MDEFEQLRIPATVPDDWRSYDVVVTWHARTPGGLDWVKWSVAERTVEPGSRPSGFAEPTHTELAEVPSLTVHRTRIATLTRTPGAFTELRIFPAVSAEDVRGQVVYAVTLERRS